MPARLSIVDELTRADHTFLKTEDTCYYLGEYTARAGFAFSQTNDLIQNLKKPMDRKDRPEWRYKTSAIDKAAEITRDAIPEEWLRVVTFVPMPPSKIKTHPDYDDRLLQILHKVGKGILVRELLVMIESGDPAHRTDNPRRILEVEKRMGLEQLQINPAPVAACIFDDVLTTGAHFKAAEATLRTAFPDIAIFGLFLARRVPEAWPI